MNLDAFFKLSYGLYIVSSFDDKHMTGHISNTVFQVTAEPARFAIASHKKNLTTEYIHRSKAFGISVIEQNVDMEFIGKWGFKSGHDFNKFVHIGFQIGRTGTPIVLEKVIAWFECNVIDSLDTGTHILFIGELVNYDLINEHSTPLTYDYYRRVIKGISPKNSPTYLKGYKENYSNPASSKNKIQQYQCIVCGYIYNPEIGDTKSNIKAGTPFDMLPANWNCPVCGVTKTDFKLVDFL